MIVSAAVKFERFFRAAAELGVDESDLKRFSDSAIKSSTTCSSAARWRRRGILAAPLHRRFDRLKKAWL
jgi:hypothetical protein